ncbi:MAG: hypothetical protein VZS44_09400 [Bacilli bacterium]|nr:hypothetical protein [Bacilli bacterium]
MLKIKDLLKENCMLKLYLLDLQESFNELSKRTTDKELRRYIRDVNKSIDNVLNINEKENIEDLVEKVKE